MDNTDYSLPSFDLPGARCEDSQALITLSVATVLNFPERTCLKKSTEAPLHRVLTHEICLPNELELFWPAVVIRFPNCNFTQMRFTKHLRSDAPQIYEKILTISDQFIERFNEVYKARNVKPDGFFENYVSRIVGERIPARFIGEYA